MPHEPWIDDIRKYCEEFCIPIEYLCDTLREPKVIPMIRGKAFEFSVMLALQKIMPKEEWTVRKDRLNAQSGSHDIDVQVLHRPTGKMLSIECKLAGKETYTKKGSVESISVKCMRSRTLGVGAVAQRAPKLGISIELLTAHQDQYMPSDFDIVVTSIANAFYATDDNGFFVWDPKEKGIDFLRRLFGDQTLTSEQLKKRAFETMYFAHAKELAVREGFLVCGKKNCPTNTCCGFIPNYPKILFDAHMKPINGWHPLAEAPALFAGYVN